MFGRTLRDITANEYSNNTHSFGSVKKTAIFDKSDKGVDF